MEKAKLYWQQKEFAFFHVNFGTMKRDYLDFTELEKAFIMKEYESKTVTDNTHTRNAFFNAYANANRKKGKKFQELFTKKQEEADIDYNLKAIEVVINMEEHQGKSWVDRIYRANGMKTRKK